MTAAAAKSGRGGARPNAGRKPGQVAKHKLDIMAAAQKHGEMALKALVDVAKDKEQPASARVTAANAILDRGFGKPIAPVEHGVTDTLAAALIDIGKRGSSAPIAED